MSCCDRKAASPTPARASELGAQPAQRAPATRRTEGRRAPGDDTVRWLLRGVDADQPVQRAPIDSGYGDIVAAARASAPRRGQVQAKCNTCEAAAATAAIHDAAGEGLAGATEPLPHAGPIQAAFGRHDVSHVRSAIGGNAQLASDRMGAAAFTSGDRIAFREPPTLGLAAHEAAHVVQQRAGLQLRDGIGASGDPWERHADRVSQAVVAGRSAEPLLDEVAPAGQVGGMHGAAIQRDEQASPTTETKDEFASRVKQRAATRLTQNIAVLGQWSSYIAGMAGFQLRAQMLSSMSTEFALAGAPTPAGRDRFETWAGTDNAAERRFRGSQLDITATYRGRVGNFVDFLASKTQGFDTSPSVADNLQVLTGERTAASLLPSSHVGPDVRYAEYAETIRKAQRHEIGGCQFCHDVNYAWDRTAKRWGSPLPSGDLFDSVATTSGRASLLPDAGGSPGSLPSASELRAIAAWIDSTGGGSPVAGAPPTAIAARPEPGSAGSPASSPPASPQANPFVPATAVPVAVAVPAPRTDLCGDLPDPKDAARIPRLSAWGPHSAIVARAISQIDTVLLPLGPRGYRVLGAQDFDALYGVGPDAMEGVRAQIIGRISARADQYATLRADILAGGVPYEELCPIVDELLPSTNQLVRSLALQDVHAWQRRERVLMVLELILLGLSVMFPPAAIVTVPAGMVLGTARAVMGFSQQRQGRQWTQGTGAGVYSLQQEAEAPGLAERGRQNVVAGAFEFGMSAISSGIMAARMISAWRDARELATILRALQDGAVITSPKFPGLTLYARRGYLLMVNEANQIVGFGQIANGQMFWTRLPVPWTPPTGAVDAMVPLGGGTAMVPLGSGTAMVPLGGGAMVPYAGGLAIPSPILAPRGPLLLPSGPVPLLLGPGSHVPPSWISSPEFNALAPHELPPVGLPGRGAQWVRQPDGSWGLQVPYGSAPGANLTTFGAGPQSSFEITIPDQSATYVTTPRTSGAYRGPRSYPMEPAAMTDPGTGVVGARSHGIPHADTPAPTATSPALATAAPGNYVDHLSHIYNERIRRTLEQRFRKAGHRWTAYNPSYSPPRYSTGGFLIPEAEVIVEYGPGGPIRAWRFPNDPNRYAALPADFEAAIAPFEIPLGNVPSTPVKP